MPILKNATQTSFGKVLSGKLATFGLYQSRNFVPWEPAQRRGIVQRELISAVVVTLAPHRRNIVPSLSWKQGTCC
jgi:hypothetical protein